MSDNGSAHTDIIEAEARHGNEEKYTGGERVEKMEEQDNQSMNKVQ